MGCGPKHNRTSVNPTFCLLQAETGKLQAENFHTASSGRVDTKRSEPHGAIPSLRSKYPSATRWTTVALLLPIRVQCMLPVPYKKGIGSCVRIANRIDDHHVAFVATISLLFVLVGFVGEVVLLQLPYLWIPWQQAKLSPLSYEHDMKTW